MSPKATYIWEMACEVVSVAIEHEVLEAIDKELEKLPYTTAEVKIVLDGKTLICKYTKNKPLIGFADSKEK